MSKTNATIVADSINTKGDRLTSMLITFPRFILGEVNTHRMLSKNTSSSRAIPFKKMVEAVQNNPFIPIAWQKGHKGMQGTEYFTSEEEIQGKIQEWLKARDEAIISATNLHNQGVTKQICNRLLEPFMWTTMLITGPKSGWDNFFKLRCPQYLDPSGIPHRSKKDYRKNSKWGCWENNENDLIGWLECNDGQSDIHMMELAECIWDIMNESTPKQLKGGEWHIPFENKINLSSFIIKEHYDAGDSLNIINLKIKVSVAMAARTSYTIVGEEGKEPNYTNDIKLHDRLAESGHWSCFEHCAKCMIDEEGNEEYYNHVKGDTSKSARDRESIYGWCNNFKGFIPYRYILNF